MKELSVGEKAKRYDEILARATGAHLPYYTEDIMTKVREFVEYLIPELKEGEESEDERIKKAIKYGLNYVFTNNTTVYETTKEQCLAWLEKQGEPKFKVGDWVVRELDDTCYQIEKCILNVTTNKYGYDLTNGGYISSQDANFYRPWTIQDAKAGDILFQDLIGGKTFIYNGVNPEMAILYSFIINNDGEDVLPYHIGKPNTGIGNTEENKNIIHPATKEQRDLLFQKMKEAGYVWDVKKLELKKVEQRPTEWTAEDEEELKIALNTLEEAGQYSSAKWLKNVCLVPQTMQKPTEWSEEDLNKIENALFGTYAVDVATVLLNRLKSLKGRYAWKPSGEQMEAMQKALVDLCGKDEHNIITGLYYDLKKLIEQR